MKRQPASMAHFDLFWTAYPRRVAKGAARRAWAKAAAIADPARILEALEAQRAAGVFKETIYTPYPATWLNQERWEDEVGPGGADPRAASLAKRYRAACIIGNDSLKQGVIKDAARLGIAWSSVADEIHRQREERL